MRKNVLTIFLSHYIWKDIAKGDKTFFYNMWDADVVQKFSRGV